MTVIASFACQALHGTGKVGLLPMDDKGYHQVVLGGFNIRNNADELYVFTKRVEMLFKPGGAVRRMIDTGNWRGEYKHPGPEGYKTLQAYIGRLRKIEELSVSHHIKSVDLVPSKDEHGRDCILVIGWVRGSGPYADAVNDRLKNNEENACFSIRSITGTTYTQTDTFKEVKVLVTYDHVNEPGISLATKYNTPSLENLSDDVVFTEEDLVLPQGQLGADLGFEAAETDLSMIRTELGWAKTEIITPGKRTMMW